MKKLYLFMCATIAVANLNAQITLTSSSHTPTIGSTKDYITDFSATMAMPQPGAAALWDFSSAGGTTVNYNYINLASSVEPATFPSANNVESTSTNAENYYLSTASSYSLVGQLTPTILRAIYTDQREKLNFPITYPNVFNETFAGTVENIGAGQTFDRSGTNIIFADGYGTLILPYATVNNVLKVTMMGSYSDLLGAVPVASYTDTIIAFYNATNNVLIASYSVLYVTGALISTSTTYLDQSDFLTGIDDVITRNNNVSIYPNPANDVIYLKSEEALTQINIFDVTGKMVKAVTPITGLTQSISVADLTKGIYFVNYTDGIEQRTTKLIVN